MKVKISISSPEHPIQLLVRSPLHPQWRTPLCSLVSIVFNLGWILQILGGGDEGNVGIVFCPSKYTFG